MAPCPETTTIATAAAPLDDRYARTERVLTALTEIVQLDTDPGFKRSAQRRFLDLTNGENDDAERA